MARFKAEIRTKPRALSARDIQALRSIAAYDIVAFTSNRAKEYFDEALRRCRVRIPKTTTIIHVGPRKDLLRYDTRGKRVLFPRSAIAPADIVQTLRTRGAIVRVIKLYDTYAVPLTRSERASLTNGTVSSLYFKSPSAVQGLLSQLRGKVRQQTLALIAECIGETTATAARKAGFSRIRIVGVQ